MKVAVISDIHANRQAFEAVLDAIADSDAQELWCLGDLVGDGLQRPLTKVPEVLDNALIIGVHRLQVLCLGRHSRYGFCFAVPRLRYGFCFALK